MDIQVKVGDYWLSTIGAWSGLRWVHRWPGGSWEASWVMADLPQDFHHTALDRGQPVHVVVGGLAVWGGVLAEPDRDTWELTATGLIREGERYIALDGSGNTSSVPDTAIDAAIVRGLPWTRPGTIGALNVSNAPGTDGINYLSDLLAERDAQSPDVRIYVDPTGVISDAADPATPSWQMSPGAAALGVDGDQYASDVYVRYFDATTSTYKTETAADTSARTRWGRSEHAVDATRLGAVLTSKATNIATKQLVGARARPGWSNDLDPSPLEITNMGGIPASLPFVQAGQMVRLHGVRDPRFVGSVVDVVIAESTYSMDDNSLILRPQGRRDRTLVDALGGDGKAFVG